MDSDVDAPPHVAKPLEVQPFVALMLAPNRVSDPASARALARPYRAVRDRLLEWTQRGDAVLDTAPAVYVHEYTSGGITIRGWVCLMELSQRADTVADRGVWPHEAIQPDQVAELAARMREMDLNPAPILLVHDGNEPLRHVMDTVTSLPADWDYVDRLGQSQRLWSVKDPATQQRVREGLAHTSCLLADGHHRYAAYLALQADSPGTGWDQGLAMIVDQSDTPLFLGPIHRVLHGVGMPALSDLAIMAGATVHRAERGAALHELAPGVLVASDGEDWITVDLGADDETATSPVEWLEAHLEDLRPSLERITHHHSVDSALERAATNDVAVLLPALEFEHVQELVSHGRLLPQKATSFQPKPSLGVIMRQVP